ncbi:DUF732 domain-containing protein [Actinomycetospora soli]|uniref:DUF732 domain-containing protein n=1 Tax=Actinomycetospora soli TaxID=2893887 RepID=UPI001E4B7FB2|nr:DUF732 domain-containing protein [Actinomycetospora soli]MCD2191241.1 DUF732 domain-containing protein [Actinomycetospora soli]
MSIEQPTYRPGPTGPIPPHAGTAGLPGVPVGPQLGPLVAPPTGYPAPQRFGGRPMHPATPPAGLALPPGWAPTHPGLRGPVMSPTAGYPGPGRRGGYSGAGGGLSVAGLVCGLVALSTSWVPWVSFLAAALAAAGVVVSSVGLHRGSSRRGAAIGGLATSALAALIALLMSALCLLGVAGGGVGATGAGPQAPVGAGAPSSQGLPTRGVSNDSAAADELFLRLLHRQAIALEDTRALGVGRGVCGAWLDGADLYSQAVTVRRAGLSDFDSGYVIGAATHAYCPAYKPRLRG